MQTVASDGLFAIATAVMLIRRGIARTVAVEAHSKASDVVSHGRIERFALDPVLNRPLGVPALAVAGLEMRRYLHESGRSAEECADVAAPKPRARCDEPPGRVRGRRRPHPAVRSADERAGARRAPTAAS